MQPRLFEANSTQSFLNPYGFSFVLPEVDLEIQTKLPHGGPNVTKPDAFTLRTCNIAFANPFLRNYDRCSTQGTLIIDACTTALRPKRCTNVVLLTSQGNVVVFPQAALQLR